VPGLHHDEQYPAAKSAAREDVRSNGRRQGSSLASHSFNVL